MRAYDSNEIIVLDFKYIRYEITKAANNVHNSVDEFLRCYSEKIGTFPNTIPPSANIVEVRNKGIAISKEIMNIVGYIYDFRIEMQNRILGPILGKRVPKREPTDESVKVLSL